MVLGEHAAFCIVASPTGVPKEEQQGPSQLTIRGFRWGTGGVLQVGG